MFGVPSAAYKFSEGAESSVHVVWPWCQDEVLAEYGGSKALVPGEQDLSPVDQYS